MKFVHGSGWVWVIYNITCNCWRLQKDWNRSGCMLALHSRVCSEGFLGWDMDLDLGIRVLFAGCILGIEV